MEIIDDTGRLFGVVNVVDALVVLLVIVAVVAGYTLLLGDRPNPDREQTNYGTIEYTVETAAEHSLVAASDRLMPVGGGDTLTVRDAAYSFTPGGSVHVVARVAYKGTPEIRNGKVHVGSGHEVATDTYRTNVRFLALNQTSPTLETQESRVVLAVNESWSVGQMVEPGTTVTVGPQTVAHVTDVSAVGRNRSELAELVGLELRTRSGPTANSFGGRPVLVNTRHSVVTNDTVISGRIYRVGTTDTAVRPER